MDVHVFGIVNEGARTYHAQFCDETYKTQDANTVISLFHEYLQQNPDVKFVDCLYIYTDSCAGQSRNRYVVSYFASRIFEEYHEKIVWSFLVGGHTKFTPDQLFGLIQGLERKHNIVIPIEWIELARNIGTEEK